MSRNTSVTLGEHFINFVQGQVAEGRFGSTSEVVRAGLHLLEGHELKVQALREALVGGEESGPARPFDREAIFERLHGRAGRVD